MSGETTRNRVGSQEIGGDRKVLEHDPIPSPPVVSTPNLEVEPMTATYEGKATARGRPLVIVREGDGNPRHGKLSTYTNHECRCAGCSEAKRAYDRELRGRRRAARAGD